MKYGYKVGDVEHYIEFSFSDIKEAFGFLKIPKRFRIKNDSKNQIGIIFAIITESNEEDQRLHHDLIAPFHKYLDSKRLSELFHIIVLSSVDSNKIKNFQDSKQFLEKEKKHLMIYGTMSKRLQEGVTNYVFNLEATILHHPIPILMSSAISKDFAQIFPRRLFFPENIELIGFEITKEWLGTSIRYIVAIAAMVSGNFRFSFELFKELEREVNSVTNQDVIIEKFRQKLPIRIVENAKLICDLLYNSYIKTDTLEPIKIAKEYIEIVMNYTPKDSQIINIASLYFYLVENNLDKCEEILTNVEHDSDSTWRLNLAFIKALKGDLTEAKKLYDKASKSGFWATNVINDVEVFLTKEIDARPARSELYFCRGYINYKLKEDFILAREDFKLFLQKSGDGKYREIVRYVNIYLDQITRKLSKKG